MNKQREKMRKNERKDVLGGRATHRHMEMKALVLPRAKACICTLRRAN